MQLPAEKRAVKGYTAHLLAVCGLLLIVYLTVMRTFSQFGFYGEDWRYLHEIAQQGSVTTVFEGHPLQRLLIEWVFTIIEFNPATGYLLLTIVIVLSALAMYSVMVLLFPRRRALAVVASTLYVLYPGDPSRLSITQGIGESGVAVLLALASLALLFAALRLRHSSTSLGGVLTSTSLAFYFLSLMLNEEQALLVPALGFVGAIWVDMSERGLSHRLTSYRMVRPAITRISPYLLVLISVVVWRIVMVDVGHEDVFASTANFNPLHLLGQFFNVYFNGYVETPIRAMLSAISFVGHVGLVVLLVVLLGLSLMAGALLLSPQRSLVRRTDVSAAGNYVFPGESRFYLRLLYVSLILTGIVAALVLPFGSGSSGDSTLVVVMSMGGAAFLMLWWSALVEQYRDRRKEIGYAFSFGFAVIAFLLVSFQATGQRDAVEAWNLQQQYIKQIVADAPRVAPGTHFHFDGVETAHGSSFVFASTTENMLRLVYGDESISASVAEHGDSGYVFNSAGLYRDEQLIAQRSRVVYFTLVSVGCRGLVVEPDCSRLVMSEGGKTGGQAYAVANSTSYHSPVEDLFGIRQADEDADAAAPGGTLAAPFDAPPE